MQPDRPIYLDHNATTYVHAAVREAMLPWLGDLWGNPSSGHPYGKQAAAAVAQARAQVAALIHAQPSEIIFTSGGTEADNLALRGPSVSRRRLVISAVEHPAIELPAGAMREQGWQVDALPVTAQGVVDTQRAASVLAEPTGLLSVILAQNETGVIQPVAELARLARASSPEVVVHTDAAQAVGKISVDVRALQVDLLTIVGHKLYAPCGIGALYIRDGLQLQGMLRGGGQERGIRPGTEPVALIVGLGAACALAQNDLAQESARQAELRERLWQQLSAGIPGLQRTGEGVDTLPNTLHVRFPGKAGADVLAAAPAVAAATGSACHHDDAAASGVLGAMGLTGAQAMGAVRLTLGRSSTPEQIDAAAAALIAASDLGTWLPPIDPRRSRRQP